jgi:hypothetical protein
VFLASKSHSRPVNMRSSEGLDERDLLEAIHALHGVYSLGWYLEAPPYSEERFARLRAESKLEPRLLNWLQRRADLHDNPQYKSEVERLRVHFIKSDYRFERLSTADQSALINTREYTQLPQPVDYGLSRPEMYVHRGRHPLNDDLKYREGEFHEWRWIFFVAFVVYICFWCRALPEQFGLPPRHLIGALETGDRRGAIEPDL